MDRAHEVTQALAGAGVFVSELSPITRSLEDVFLELTHEDPGRARADDGKGRRA